VAQAPGPDARTVDVVAIMREIRENIQKKREQGIYTEEEVDALTDLRLRTLGEEVLIDPRLVEGLRGPGRRWNIASDYEIRTTRPGLAGAALVAVKKLVRPFIRLYTDHVVNRQSQLNLYFAHLLHANIRETARLQVELQELRHRCRALEAEREAGRRAGG
jgi:O-antigen chain-terminating methyltransferase